MLPVQIVTLCIFPVLVSSFGLYSRQACGEMYKLCSPLGAVTSQLPSVGPQLANLYSDLVQAINSESKTDTKSSANADILLRGQDSNSFCCAQNSECLLLDSYGTAFCWDRFTTNYYFPDGSYGSIVAGNYTSATGINVNLIYGDWEDQDGTEGNIYSNVPTMMPHTSTLPMPTAWTSTGIGSAIPASELGSTASITTSSGSDPSTTTISAVTLASTTISIGTSACTHCNITIIPGLTGLPPHSSVPSIYTNGTTYPTTTITRNATGTTYPSAGGGNHTSTGIIPSITKSVASTFITLYYVSACIAVVSIAIGAFSP